MQKNVPKRLIVIPDTQKVEVFVKNCILFPNKYAEC